MRRTLTSGAASGDEDGRADAELARGEGLREAGVAARRDDDADVVELSPLAGCQLPVEGTPGLEDAAVLQVLALEPDGVATGRPERGSTADPAVDPSGCCLDVTSARASRLDYRPTRSRRCRPGGTSPRDQPRQAPGSTGPSTPTPPRGSCRDRTSTPAPTRPVSHNFTAGGGAAQDHHASVGAAASARVSSTSLAGSDRAGRDRAARMSSRGALGCRSAVRRPLASCSVSVSWV